LKIDGEYLKSIFVAIMKEAGPYEGNIHFIV